MSDGRNPFAQAGQVISFTTAGIPAPQGSKTRTRWGMREDNPNTKPWRGAVAADATDAMNGQLPIAGPVELVAFFYFPRPKSHFRTGRHADQLKPAAPEYHASKPDADKLLRAIGDAITGIVVRDDAQIVRVFARKLYGAPRAVVAVQPIDTELKFGRDVALLIEGRCNKTGAEGATDREGDLDVVIGHKGVKIHSLSKPAGADWVQDTT